MEPAQLVLVAVCCIVVSGWATKKLMGRRKVPLAWYLLGLILAPLFVPLAILKFILDGGIGDNIFHTDD